MCTCRRPPVPPPLPEPISFKIAQRSTRQLNLNPDSPDPKASRPPLPEPSSAPLLQPPAAIQARIPQKADDPSAVKAAPDVPQLSAAVPTHAEQHQPNSDPVQDAALEQQANDMTSVTPLQIPVSPTDQQPGSPAVPSAAAAVNKASKGVHAAGDAHEAAMSISPTSPDSLAAEDNSHTADATHAPGASAHPLQRAVEERPAPVAKDVSPFHDQQNHLQISRPRHRPSSQDRDASHHRRDTTNQPPEASFSGRQQSSDRADIPNRAGSHGRASSHDRAVPHDRAMLHDRAMSHDGGTPDDRAIPYDRAMPHDRVMAHDMGMPHDRVMPHERAASNDRAMLHDRTMPHRAMSHDRLSEHGRQPQSYQPERPRPSRRFSDHPSGSRSPEQKRSRDPEHIPYQDYHKRPRTDTWQPAAPSQAAHHRHLEILNAKREADRLAAIRKQEERASSQSQSPASDRRGQVPNGRHASRHMPESRFANHHEHSRSRSPSARQASITPEPNSATRLNQRHTAHDRPQSDAHRDLHRGDPSRHPPAQYHDPSLRRNGSWSTMDPHSVHELGASRKYSNYGRHPQLSSLDAPPSVDHLSTHDQDPLQRRGSSLHSSDAASLDAERHRSRAPGSLQKAEVQDSSEMGTFDRGNRRRSFEPPPQTSKAQPAMHQQHSHDYLPEVAPRHHPEPTRHATSRRSSEHARAQTQQQSEAAKLAAATKLAQNTGRLMAHLCQLYGVPANAMGNGPKLKNEHKSGLLDRMSAAMRTAEAQACNAISFTVTAKVCCGDLTYALSAIACFDQS